MLSFPDSFCSWSKGVVSRSVARIKTVVVGEMSWSGTPDNSSKKLASLYVEKDCDPHELETVSDSVLVVSSPT